MKKMFVKTIFLIFLILSAAFAAFGESKTFTISTSYLNLLSNPEGTGMLDKILKETFKRIGIDAEIVYTKTEKSLFDVNAGLFDAEINRIEGMETAFPNLIRIPESNMTMYFVAFSKKHVEIHDWESIRNYSIGLVGGWKILEEATADFPNVTRVPTEIELFNMLQLGRIDLALYSKLTGYALVNQMRLTGIAHIEPPLSEREMFLYVHKRHSGKVGEIAEALRSVKAYGTWQKIADETLKEYGVTPGLP